MRVVPRVVVDERGTVRHTADLVAVVPPGHNLGVGLGVLAQPVVGFAVIVDDVLGAVGEAGGEDDRRRGVGVRGDPGAVKHEEHEVDARSADDGELADIAVDAHNRLAGGAQAIGEDSSSSDARSISFVLLLNSDLGLLGAEIGVEDLGESHGASNAHNGRQSEHQAHHDAGEVAGKHGVDDDEDLFIGQLLEAHVHAGGEQPDHHVEVEEESRPGGRLVLGHGGDNGDMNLSIAGIPERVEATGPRCDDTSHGEQDEATQSNNEDDEDEGAEQRLELLAGHLRADVVDEGNELEETEDT